MKQDKLQVKESKPVPFSTDVKIVPDSSSPEGLIAMAIEKGVDVETLERLLAMREKLRAEQAKEAYDKAMATFQGECPEIEKTKPVKTKTGALAYKYAPIEDIVKQVKPLLTKHGFSYSIKMDVEKNKDITSTCVVKHSGGHTEEYSMTVPLSDGTQIMSTSQITAAASTFAKRYAFCNAFGIMTAEGDDDTASLRADAPGSGPVKPSEAQAKYISDLQQAKNVSREDLAEIMKKYKTPSEIIEHLKAL